MTKIYDTLHPKNNPTDDLYPNIDSEQNIQDDSVDGKKLKDKSISFSKLNDEVESKINKVDDFDSRITQVEEEVATYDNRITGLESTVSNHQNKIENLETESETLDSRVSATEDSIVTLGTSVSELNEDKLDKYIPETSNAYVYGVAGSSKRQHMYELGTLQGGNIGSIPVYGSHGHLYVGTPTSDSYATNKKYVDDADSVLDGRIDGVETSLSQKLDKITNRTGTNRVYAIDGLGQQTTLKVESNTIEPNTLAQRTADGTIIVGTPQEDDDASTKKYVDDADSVLGGRIDGVETSLSQKLNQQNPTIAGTYVYVASQYGQGMLPVDTNAVADTIVQRKTGGEVDIRVPLEPQYDDEPASKKYVDDHSGSSVHLYKHNIQAVLHTSLVGDFRLIIEYYLSDNSPIDAFRLYSLLPDNNDSDNWKECFGYGARNSYNPLKYPLFAIKKGATGNTFKTLGYSTADASQLSEVLEGNITGIYDAITQIF